MKNTLTLGDLKNLNLPIYVHCAFNTYKVKRVILETGDIYNFDNFFTEEPDDNYPGAA
jgi:hypothetical protein